MALDFISERVGEQNILSAVVHMDERTPHMHLCFGGQLIVWCNRHKAEVHMGRSLVHMDDSGEDILLSNTLRNESQSHRKIRCV